MNTIKLMLGATLLVLCIPVSFVKASASRATVWEKMAPWHGDVETKEERLARLKVIDIAIDRAVEQATCDKKDKGCKPQWRGAKEDLRWLLIGQAYFETHLAQHVHEDKCRAKLGECDSGKAKSLWQIQKASNALLQQDGPDWWESIGGVDQAATDKAAWAATVILSRTYNRCRSISGAISMYATGKTCFWEEGRKRAIWIGKARAHYAPRIAH